MNLSKLQETVETVGPGMLQFMGWQRVRHNLVTKEEQELREASSPAGRPAGTHRELWRRAQQLVRGRQNRVRPTRVVCAIEMAEKAHEKMLSIMNY